VAGGGGRSRPAGGRRDRGGGVPGVRRAGPPARQLGGEQVEGRQAVRELLAAGRRRVREVWLAAGQDDAPVLAEIAGLAEAGRVPVRIVSRGRLDAAAQTDAPQGVLARAQPLAEADLEDLGRVVPGRPPPFLLVLDGVTDPHNLGALLRTAECAGATGAVLPRHRSAMITPTVAKAAAGAIEHLPLAVAPGIPAALATLGAVGVWSVGLDGASPASLWDLDLADQPVALVLGAEGRGLSRLVRDRCDQLLAIPQ
jgi:23S rRNA (guanosine2251-2'-O)-methyltransferase